MSTSAKVVQGVREVLASLQAVQIEQHEECWDAGTRVGSVRMGNVLAYALATGTFSVACQGGRRTA